MFSRLNEAVPLNSAEKRRAIGGDIVKAVDDVAKHDFFAKKVRFSNKRYQHKETAIRALFLEHHLRLGKIVDTKKPLLDAFAKEYKTGHAAHVRSLKSEINGVLTEMAPIFIDSDPLLVAQATVPVYLLTYRQFKTDGKTDKFVRTRLIKFNEARTANRVAAERDIATADYELLEYDRLSQQGTNDANSIRDRVRILSERLLKR